MWPIRLPGSFQSVTLWWSSLFSSKKSGSFSRWIIKSLLKAAKGLLDVNNNCWILSKTYLLNIVANLYPFFTHQSIFDYAVLFLCSSFSKSLKASKWAFKCLHMAVEFVQILYKLILVLYPDFIPFKYLNPIIEWRSPVLLLLLLYHAEATPPGF